MEEKQQDEGREVERSGVGMRNGERDKEGGWGRERKEGKREREKAGMERGRKVKKPHSYAGGYGVPVGHGEKRLPTPPLVLN